MAKKTLIASLKVVSHTNLGIIVSTEGTRSASGTRILNWTLEWGDEKSDRGSGNPPINLSHDYLNTGNYNITLNVTDNKSSNANKTITVIIITIGAPTPTPPPTNVYGPQASITCPINAIGIPAGSTTASRQTLINANPIGSIFCLEAGSHSANGSNAPKNSNIFVGQFGAVVDGTGWASSNEVDGVFSSSSADNVTIRNLIMRHLPQRGVVSYPWDGAINWIIEYCEINDCKEGIIPGNGSIIRNNKIYDCYRVGHPVLAGSAIFAGGAYPNLVSNVLIDTNEMHHFGATQKLLDATGIIWRNNYIHHSDGPAVWNDGYGDGFIAENNTLEDNNVGVMFELSFGGIIRNNIIRRSADQAVFITTSRNTEIFNNTLEDNFRAIAYFVNCLSVNQFPWNPDLSNNNAYDNTIRVPNTVGVLANFLSYSGTCVGSQPDPYVNNTKNNNFINNDYQIPDLNGFYWLYGGGLLDWTAWQAKPQDVGGSISL
jgi:parallel beta-helix repeat protein